jgi:hypothetical protein
LLLRRFERSIGQREVVTLRRIDAVDHAYQEPYLPEDRRNKLPDVDYTETIKNLERRYGRVEPPENSYRSVKEVGVIRNVGNTCSGVITNAVMHTTLRGLDNMRGFLSEWSLTDTSAAGTFGVYDEKVDRAVVEDNAYREIDQQAWDVYSDYLVAAATKIHLLL